jgi:acrylyl-CoA reductase (NADPH)
MLRLPAEIIITIYQMMLNKNLFPVKYRSLKIFKNKKNKIEIKITNDNFLYERDVKKNFVLIKVLYSNINYKDLLMCKNNNNLIKKFPHTPGIDSSGVVYYSKSNKFKKMKKYLL